MSEPSRLSNSVLEAATKPSSSPGGLADPVISVAQTSPRASTLTVNWRDIYDREQPTSDPPEGIPGEPDYSPGLPDKLRQAMNAVTLGRAPWPLVIIGEAGGGKTDAVLLMLKRWSDLEGHVYFNLAASYIERVRLARVGELQWSTGYPATELEVVDQWARPHLAAMDELGTRDKATPFQSEVIQRCIESRIGRPAVYTSNIPLQDLAESYTDRIASRLNAGTVVNVKGDQRKGKTFDG